MYEEIISFVRAGDDDALVLEMAGVSYCDGSYHISRQNAPMMVLEYISRGEGHVEVDGRRFTAVAGDVYLLPLGSTHRYASSRGNPWVKQWMNVSGPLCAALCQAYALEGVYHVPGLDLSREFEQLLGMARATADAGEASQKAAILLHAMLQRMRRCLSAAGGQAQDSARKLKRFLDESLERPVRVEQMAAHIYRCPSQANRLFQKAYGVTPYRYLARRRLERAALLLRNTNLPVGDIARRLCFADARYFANAFRARYDETPTAFRKKQWGNRL
ncbi:MAG: AraC family transcriptional regulator [Eubacteriales bacterium]|nr:AraC family transcriptional regulator [Eubacteriales bacterium]